MSIIKQGDKWICEECGNDITRAVTILGDDAAQMHMAMHEGERYRKAIADKETAVKWLNKCFKYLPDCVWRDDLRHFLEEQERQKPDVTQSSGE